MTGLARAVRTVVRRCLAVAPGENVLVVVDEPLQDVGEALRREAQDAQADAVLAVMSPRENHGEEPPPPHKPNATTRTRPIAPAKTIAPTCEPSRGVAGYMR